MNIDSNTKIIVVNDEYEYSTITLPDPSNLDQKHSYLITDEAKLFQLKEVNGNNPYQKNNITLPKSTESVKSWIFEPESGSPIKPVNGSILQSSNLIVSSAFNPVYLLISILYKNPLLTKRFITVEDFIDSLTGLFSDDWVQKLSPRFPSCLELISETIIENDEKFYKFSLPVTFDFLGTKVENLVAHFDANPDLQIMKHIKSKLYQSNETEASIPAYVLKQAIQLNCINLILGTYCLPELTSQFITSKAYNFMEYEQYLKLLDQKLKDLQAVEQNMNSVVESSSKASKKKVDTKKKTDLKKKAPVKKVAIGKGALDGFFKKA